MSFLRQKCLWLMFGSLFRVQLDLFSSVSFVLLRSIKVFMTLI